MSNQNGQHPTLERKPSFSSLPAVIVHNYSVDSVIGPNGTFGEVYKAKAVGREGQKAIDVEIRTYR